MKKLLSVVLVLAMLASMCVYLPMGVSATENDATTIYSEDFTDMDGTYTLGELADLLGWALLRGDENAAATIEGGKLTIDAVDLENDVLFEIANDSRLTANHTYQYDMAKVLRGGNLFFAGIYTGTDNGETVKAIFAKTTYENYNHMVLANGVINDTNQRASGFVLQGSSYDQTRPECIPGGGENNTWKTVVDVTNNQIDAYAAGGRINSTKSSTQFAAYNVADYVGNGAYLRVQKSGSATFDNITIVTGGEAVVVNSNVVFEQDFSAIPDGTYTGAEMAQLTGFQSFAETTAVATMVYKIANGRLEILADGDNTNSFTFKNNPQFATLYVPEMETATDTVVIEYDMTYLYDANDERSANSGDTPFGIEMYGRRSDFHAFWQFTPKGFPQYGFYKGSYTESGTSYSITQNGIKTTNGYYSQSQGRWEDTAFNAPAATYIFSNGSYGHSLTNSTESVKVVMSVKNGFYIYVNDVLAVQLTQAGLEAWTSTMGGGNASHIIGNILRMRMPAGCHVALDNFKITVDPEAVKAPDLWLTEQSCGVKAGTWCTADGMEYVEVYNASNKAINIYDYAFVQRAYNNSCDNVGTAIGLDNIHLAYPGDHTYKSIKTDEVTGLSLYTLTVSNPSYADGWIQPGEVVMLWNKTDSMHNSGYGAPTVITTEGAANYGMGNFGHLVEADFRAALSIPEGVKVFTMYNDYNRAFNNSGSHIVGLIDRAKVQAGYDPATGTGDEALTNANIGWTDYKSTLLDVTADTNSSRTAKTVTYASYDVTEAIGYSSVVFARPDSAVDATGMTPGYLKDSQKKAFTVTVDGSAKSAYLGEDYTYAYDDSYTGAPKFYKDLFAVVDGVIVMADDPAYGTLTGINAAHTVQRYKVAMTTVPGVGIRFGGENEYNEDDTGYIEAAGLRWVTGVKNSHIDALLKSGLVANVEIGTMITRDGAALDETAKKVVAYQNYWFSETADANYADMVFFAGSVKNMFATNYDRNYKGVGYVTVTLLSGEEITVTGDYTDENEDNVINIADLAYADPDNGLTDAEIELLDIYFEQYDALA